jgi:hypothetical protein
MEMHPLSTMAHLRRMCCNPRTYEAADTCQARVKHPTTSQPFHLSIIIDDGRGHIIRIRGSWWPRPKLKGHENYAYKALCTTWATARRRSIVQGDYCLHVSTSQCKTAVATEEGEGGQWSRRAIANKQACRCVDARAKGIESGRVLGVYPEAAKLERGNECGGTTTRAWAETKRRRDKECGPACGTLDWRGWCSRSRRG